MTGLRGGLSPLGLMVAVSLCNLLTTNQQSPSTVTSDMTADESWTTSHWMSSTSQQSTEIVSESSSSESTYSL
ncbi:unnamed protein product [Lampetra planeri]